MNYKFYEQSINTIISPSSLQLIANNFSTAVMLNKLSPEDINQSFAAQHSICFESVKACKDKLLYWNECDPGKYGKTL